MKKILAAISVTSFMLAVALTVVAVNSGAEANAQEADLRSESAARTASPETASAIGHLAEDLLDKLVAEGTMTEADADAARDSIATVRERLAMFDWDSFAEQVQSLVERIRVELADTDWGTIRSQIEDALRDLEPELGDDVPQLDASEWSELEDAFNRFRDELDRLDLDLMLERVERHIDGIDWDAWSAELRGRLDEVDLSGLDQFDASEFEEEFEATAEELKRYLQDIDWDDIVGQFEGFDF